MNTLIIKNQINDLYRSNKKLSLKIERINELISMSLPTIRSLDAVLEIALEIHIMNINTRFSFFNSNPFGPILKTLLNHYMFLLVKEIEISLIDKERITDASSSIFNRKLMDQFDLHRCTLQIFAKINRTTVEKIYHKYRQYSLDEISKESYEKIEKIEEYERELKLAWCSAGFSDVIKK
ncbi:hypothetical protein [Legionella sainthelensi]|uniref:Uncharacterized protein n=1 Tax=Legionella sainthelensi TaxID=28087 RepID=A0A2H5FLZ8_9GAMM|nr:hypothetical protein [Legionella sainthelensi]AUH72588.1 hypothetical protein CAB17_11380 [Legionella sainthelensi]